MLRRCLQRYAIIEAVIHMVNRDFAALAKLYQELGFIPADEDITPVVQALNNALPDVLNASVTELNIKSVVERLGDVFYMYPFSLPPFYVAIIRCLGVLEGVALQVDGSFAIIQDAYPYNASRLLTDPSPRLQAALYSLIFRNGELQWNYLEGLLEKASKSSDSDMNALVSAVEQLADYLLSPEGEPALNSLKLQLVEELDELGAESASYVLQSLTSILMAPQPGGAAASSGSSSSGSGSSSSQAPAMPTIPGPLGIIIEQMGVALNQLPLPPPSPRLERAVRTLERLQRSAIASEVDLTRVGTLVATLLAQEAVQRQLTDFTLQLVQRACREESARFCAAGDSGAAQHTASQPAKPSFYERRRQAKQQQKEEEAKKKFEPPQSSSSSQPKSAVDGVESVIDPSLRDVVS